MGGRQAAGVAAGDVEPVLEGDEPDAFWDLFALGEAGLGRAGPGRAGPGPASWRGARELEGGPRGPAWSGRPGPWRKPDRLAAGWPGDRGRGALGRVKFRAGP